MSVKGQAQLPSLASNELEGETMLKKVGLSLKSLGNAHSSLTTDVRPAQSLVAKLFLVSLFGTLAFAQLHGSSVS